MPSKSSVSDGSDQYTSASRRSIVLNPEELELWELFYYAGLTVDPQIFRVFLDLIHLDVHPRSILEVMESIAPNSRYYASGGKKREESNVGRKSKAGSQIPASGAASSSRKTSKSSSDTGKSDSFQQIRKSSHSKPDRGSGDSKPAK